MGYAAVVEAHNGDDDDDDRGADHMPQMLMTTAEAARHLGISPGHLSSLRCWGLGPRWRRIGAKNVRYERADLDAWKKCRAVATGPSSPSIGG